MWGVASDERIDRALHTLQATLDLSPAQVKDIRQLAVSRRDTFRSIREEAMQKCEQLMELLDQPNPDPATVGRATIELKAVHDQARSNQADLENQLSNLLTPDQRKIVDSLRHQARTFVALRSIGLLGGARFAETLMSRPESSDSESGDKDY